MTELIIESIICITIPNILYFIIYFKTQIFEETIQIFTKKKSQKYKRKMS